MKTPSPAQPIARIPVDQRMTLELTADGAVVVIHTSLASPVPVNMTQLASWLRRQLRETV